MGRRDKWSIISDYFQHYNLMKHYLKCFGTILTSKSKMAADAILKNKQIFISWTRCAIKINKLNQLILILQIWGKGIFKAKIQSWPSKFKITVKVILESFKRNLRNQMGHNKESNGILPFYTGINVDLKILYWFFFFFFCFVLFWHLQNTGKAYLATDVIVIIFLRNRSLSDARWFYGKKRKIGKGNLYITENR